MRPVELAVLRNGFGVLMFMTQISSQTPQPPISVYFLVGRPNHVPPIFLQKSELPFRFLLSSLLVLLKWSTIHAHSPNNSANRLLKSLSSNYSLANWQRPSPKTKYTDRCSKPFSTGIFLSLAESCFCNNWAIPPHDLKKQCFHEVPSKSCCMHTSHKPPPYPWLLTTASIHPSINHMHPSIFPPEKNTTYIIAV